MSLWTMIPFKFNAWTVSNATQVVTLSVHVSERILGAKLNSLAITRC